MEPMPNCRPKTTWCASISAGAARSRKIPPNLRRRAIRARNAGESCRRSPRKGKSARRDHVGSARSGSHARTSPIPRHPCKSRIAGAASVAVAVADGRPCHPGALKPAPQRGTPSAVPSNPNSRLGRAASPIAQGWVKMDAIFVGIDVSKDRLDVHVLPGAEAFAVARDGRGLEALVERLRALAPTLVAVEATGGFEMIVAAAVAGAKLPLAVVNPAQIRHFAQ